MLCTRKHRLRSGACSERTYPDFPGKAWEHLKNEFQDLTPHKKQCDDTTIPYSVYILGLVSISDSTDRVEFHYCHYGLNKSEILKGKIKQSPGK